MAADVVVSKKAWPRRLPQLVVGSWQALRYNPIIAKELRYRMRSWRGLVDLATCTIIVGVFGLINYSSNSSSYRYSYNYGYGYNPTYGSNSYYALRSQEMGTNYFLTMIVALLFLACVLAPNFSAGTIAGEKERQTYDVLLMTLLRPRDIIIGKLVASLAYLLLVIVAAIPVASVAFLIGGVGFDQFIVALLTTLATAIMLGTIGIYWSSAMRTTREASRNAFLNVLIMFFALPIGLLFFLSSVLRSTFSFRFVIYSESLLTDATVWLLSINPMYAVLATNDILRNRSASNLFFYFSKADQGDFYLTPFTRFIMLALVITVTYVWLAARRIKPLRAETDKRAAKAARKKLTQQVKP